MYETCPARRPQFDRRPIQLCALPAEHAGDHIDALGVHWAPRSEEAERLLARLDEEEAALFRLVEWKTVERRLAGLYQRAAAGDTSVLTRQRIARCEALQAALCGHPAALAG